MVGKTHEPTIRTHSLDDWREFMERGEGGQRLFDIAEWDGDFLVVQLDGKMLAYLQHQSHEHQADWHVLNRPETHPYYRKRGYAQKVVEQVIKTYDPATIVARGVQLPSVEFLLYLKFVPDSYGPDCEQE